MKVYVASKFENKEKVREVYARLRDIGISITHDWTREDASNKAQHYKRDCAIDDYLGVKNADAVLVLNHPQMFGGASEMGMALAWKIPVVVVDHEVRWNIFFELPQVVKARDLNDAISFIEDLANDRG